MKDFNIDYKTTKEVIENFCKKEEYAKYNFNIDELMAFAAD